MPISLLLAKVKMESCLFIKLNLPEPLLKLNAETSPPIPLLGAVSATAKTYFSSGERVRKEGLVVLIWLTGEAVPVAASKLYT